MSRVGKGGGGDIRFSFSSWATLGNEVFFLEWFLWDSRIRFAIVSYLAKSLWNGVFEPTNGGLP